MSLLKYTKFINEPTSSLEKRFKKTFGSNITITEDMLKGQQCHKILTTISNQGFNNGLEHFMLKLNQQFPQ